MNAKESFSNSIEDVRHRLEGFLKASEALLQSATLEQTLSTIVALAEETLSADAYAVWRMDPEAMKLRLVVARGLSADYLKESEIEFPEARLGEVIVTDTRHGPLPESRRRLQRTEGIRSLLMLPLVEGTQDFGFLVLYYRSRHRFGEFELQFARTLANLSSAAIAAAEVAEGHTKSKQDLEDTLARQQKAEDGLHFINKAGLVLNESLDIGMTLKNLTQTVVPELADWCAVHMLENNAVQLVAFAHYDPPRERLARVLQERYPDKPHAPHGAFNVIMTGEPQLVTDVTPEQLVEIAQDTEYVELLRGLGFRSFVSVPMRTTTEIIGAISLIQADSGRRFDAGDLELVEELGRRAGLAVEKARLYEASELSRAELERSNRAKDEFLGIVSHELRTPITTIYGSARLLLSAGTTLPEEDRNSLIANIEQDSTRMVRLVENLLMLARLEVGQAVEKVAVNVDEMTEKVAAETRGHGRDVRITGPAGVKVYADRLYLEHILTNLITNADKYSPAGDPLEVVIEVEPELVIFRVLDTGPGVEPSELELIFDSFYRSDRTAHLPGKGLGLAICKRLTEAQGGQIWARLRPSGGLEVGFAFPRP